MEKIEKFTLINKDRSRIKVFEPFEDVSKPSPSIDAMMISYGCVYKRSSKPVMKGSRVETIEAASWTVIKSTEVEDDILFVEIFVPEYNITGYWELYVEGNEVTGYAFDRFDIVGTKSD